MLIEIQSVRNADIMRKRKTDCYAINFLLEFQASFENDNDSPRSTNRDNPGFTNLSECFEIHDGNDGTIKTHFLPMSLLSN